MQTSTENVDSQNMTQEDIKRRETTVKNLIGYEWKEASNGAKIEVVNPATSELIDTVPNVTEEDVEKFGKVIDQLIELKNSGILINNTEEYLKFTKEHIQKLDGRCTMLSEIRLNCARKLMCCCDKKGEVVNYFTIFDLENENKLNVFLKMQESDRATCAGCLWPSVYESAIREKK